MAGWKTEEEGAGHTEATLPGHGLMLVTTAALGSRELTEQSCTEVVWGAV